MLLGPVFGRELMVTARRRRYYVLRSAYGLAVLAVLAAVVRHAPADPDRGALAGAWLAFDLFRCLLLVQGAAIVVLTPALVAGAIAEEAQKRTLHELLASDLTAAEIVLGKLAARLSHVAVLAATGLPLLLLTGLLGGLGGWLVFASLAATFTTAYFLGGLSILASTQARSVRGAMNFTFTLTLSWLILPGAVDVLLPRGGMPGLELHEWLGPINAWIAPTSPFAVWVDVTRGSIRGPEALLDRVLWMSGLQLLYGSLLAALAVARLRPSFRAREAGRKRRPDLAFARVCRPLMHRRRPRCGDDPMLWKEVLLPRTPAFYRPLGLLAVLVLGGLLTWTTISLAAPAFVEVLAWGYGVAPAGSSRATFHVYLRVVGTGVSLVYLLGVASDAAAGLTTERERDTWISLVATPMTGTEIIRGKMLGAIWNIRHTAVVLLVLWLVGVLVGSVHPLGVLGVLLELAAFTWFAAAFGTWISLRSRRTMQALARVMAGLLLLNGGALLVTLPLLAFRPLALTACGPLLLAATLASYGDVHGTPTAGAMGGLVTDGTLASLWVGHGLEMAVACLLSVLGSGLGAWALTRSACRSFDACLDRPAVAPPTGTGSDTGRRAGRTPTRPRTRLRSLDNTLRRV